ncbi:acyl-CoA oxidase [Streptomyces durbertensis]|uniref:Acyl-CoA oxidase n=1 Tax=Streptomyces durbertensis TaxID=2448886 RepID=A0ABR6EED0_9ACTN|nr:acyl-CoA oxidase [Streptomyces durbertensis]
MRALGALLPPDADPFADPARLASVHAQAAVTDPSLCLAGLVHYVLCLGSMAHLSDEKSKLAKEIDDLRAARAKGVYLVTEVGQAGSHLATRTRADLAPDGRGFVLHTPHPAAAKFGSAGTLDVPQTAVVLARLFTAGTDRGVFGFVVDLTADGRPADGVEISSPIGLGALPLDYVQVRFNRVRLPYGRWLSDGARINEDGVFHDPAGSPGQRLPRTLRVGQGLWATMPAVAAATSRQSAVQAVNLSRQRRSHGRLAPGEPLIAYRTQQRAVLGALADAFALTRAAHGAQQAWRTALASAAVPAPGPVGAQGPPEHSGFAPWVAVSQPLAAYKAASVRLAARVTAECQRRCGFLGHLDVHRLGPYHGFHHAFDAAGGDSQLILYDVGRTLVEQHRAGRQTTPPADDDPPVGTPGWWPSVLRRHRHALTEQLARHLADSKATDPFEAWNPLLEDAGHLGEVYGAQLLAQDAAHDVTTESGAAPGPHRLPEALAALHGVTAARRWSGPLLALGTLRPADVAELPSVTDRLCDRLLPQLPLLLQAFAHPPEVGGTPLTAPDHNAALAATLTWNRGGTA